MLAELAEENNAGIVVLTESHLKEDIRDAEIKIDEFEIFRTDREAYKNGGVIIYVKSKLNLGAKCLLSISHNKIELMIIKFTGIDTILIAIYRPPDATLSSFLYVSAHIREVLEEYSGLEQNIILTGDLNMPIINWENGLITGGTLESQCQARELIDLSNEYFLEQYVSSPTRVNNILDLFFSNNEEILLNIEVLPPTILSDHQLIIAKTAFVEELSDLEFNEAENLGSLNFLDNKIDWQSIEYAFDDIKWSEIFNNQTVQEMYDLLLDHMLIICRKYVPKKNARRKRLIPRDRKILMRNKAKLSKKLETASPTKRSEITRKITMIEHNIADSHVAEAISNEKRALSKIKDDPKYFFRYARSKSKVRSPIGPFLVRDEFVHEPRQKANLLLEQYDSVYCPTKYVSSLIQELSKYPGPRSLDDLVITDHDVKIALGSLSPNASPGPDEVPSILLVKCKESLSAPIKILWNKSLCTGEIPTKLKFGKIIPIFKGGDRCLPSNYRPVTLTSHLIKVIEKIIVKKMVEYMSEACLFNRHQHGFRTGRSCLSQLIEHFQSILQGMEAGMEVEVVYLDFCKAFDKVDHKILLQKLASIGISGDVFRWIGEFILERTHVVVADKIQSKIGEMRSGVPQGSVLGPLLFLIMISDIDGQLDASSASSFADDTRVTMYLSKNSDTKIMQEELSKIYEWAEDNLMIFNETKFEHLEYTSHLPYEPDRWLLTGDGVKMEKPETVRDLGVMIQNNGSFTNNIEHVVKKAYRQIAWIMRTFKSRDQDCMITLYKATVLPMLEYCSQLWSPVKLGDIRKLENVQRNFTRRIEGMSALTYWDRLRKLNMYSLERRRERYSILYLYKIYLGIAPDFENVRWSIKTRFNERRGLQFVLPSICTSATAKVRTMVENSFAVRGPRLFNNLPAGLKTGLASYESFKRQLDKYLNSVADEPSLPNYPSQINTNSLLFRRGDWRNDGS